MCQQGDKICFFGVGNLTVLGVDGELRRTPTTKPAAGGHSLNEQRPRMPIGGNR